MTSIPNSPGFAPHHDNHRRPNNNDDQPRHNRYTNYNTANSGNFGNPRHANTNRHQQHEQHDSDNQQQPDQQINAPQYTGHTQAPPPQTAPSHSSNDTHCLYQEITQPTSILHTVRCSFISPCANNLITIKTGILEIYNIDHQAGENVKTTLFASTKDSCHVDPVSLVPDHAQNTAFPSLPSTTSLYNNIIQNNAIPSPILTLHTTCKLYGTVVGIDSVLLPKQTTESIVLLFDNNSISIVHWDPLAMALCTVFLHDAELRDMSIPHGSAVRPNQTPKDGSTDQNSQVDYEANDKFTLQHKQQEQLYPSTLLVDKINKLIIICQAGSFISIYAPNADCEYLLFSPSRASYLSPLVTHQLTDGDVALEKAILQQCYLEEQFSKTKHDDDDTSKKGGNNNKYHIETPHHCIHLLENTPVDRLAMTYVETINLRRYNNDVLWVKDMISTYNTKTNSTMLICLTNTELTWEGRYASTKHSSALVTLTLNISYQNQATSTASVQAQGLVNNPANPTHASTSNTTGSTQSNGNKSMIVIKPNVRISQTNLPHNTYKLVPLPQPISGCLIITSSSVLYFNGHSLVYAAKLSAFDFLTQDVLTIDGKTSENGISLDRVSITCLYAALRVSKASYNKRYGLLVGKPSAGGTKLERTPSNGRGLDDLDDLFSSPPNPGRTETIPQSTPANPSPPQRTMVGDYIIPYKELFNPYYADVPVIQQFSPYTAPYNPSLHHYANNSMLHKNNNVLLSSDFVDADLNGLRYCEFLISSFSGESFVLTASFPTLTSLRSISIGYLGLLSPCNAFVPLVIGAGVHHHTERGEKNIAERFDGKYNDKTISNKTNFVSSLFLACSLYGDSKIYQMERELSTAPHTTYNKYLNKLVELYNFLLEQDEDGYPVYDENDAQHAEFFRLIQKQSKSTLDSTFMVDLKEDGNHILTPNSIMLQQSNLSNNSSQFDEFGAAPMSLDSNSANNNQLVDLAFIKQLGIKLREEENEKKEKLEAQQAQQYHQKLQRKNEGDEVDQQEEPDNDEEDEELYSADQITVEQRKRRLVRPILPPFILIERDMLFSFAPLDNIQTITTKSLATGNTNTTSHLLQQTTHADSQMKYGDVIPIHLSPFLSQNNREKDSISLLASSGYAQDGKLVVYNDHITPYVINSQQLLSPDVKPQQKVEFDPDETIVDINCVTIRDIDGHLNTQLSSPQSKKNVFTDPIVIMAKIKQLLAQDGAKGTNAELITHLQQYHNTLIQLEKIAQLSSSFSQFAANPAASTQSLHNIQFNSTINTDPTLNVLLIITTSTNNTYYYTLSPVNLERFQQTLQQYEQTQQRNMQQLLLDQQTLWFENHVKKVQNEWNVNVYQNILSSQVQQHYKQQVNYIGCHTQEINKILNNIGAVSFNYVNTAAKDQVLITDQKTLATGNILGLFHAWVQVTTNNIALYSSTSHKLCHINVQQDILPKIGVVLNEALFDGSASKCSQSRTLQVDKLLYNDYYIINVLLQDPYIIIQLNNYPNLILIEFNSDLMIGEWYTLTPLLLPSVHNLNNNIINEKSRKNKKNPDTTNNTIITSMTTSTIDILSLCPQLKLFLTSSIAKLERLHAYYNDNDATQCRHDISILLNQVREVKKALAPSGQIGTRSEEDTMADETLVKTNESFDALDLLLDTASSPAVMHNTETSNTSTLTIEFERTKVEGSDQKTSKIKEPFNHDSFLTAIPHIKFLFVTTLNHLYIIDLATVNPSSLLLQHYFENGDIYDGSNMSSIISIPLFSTNGLCSTQHTLHNTQYINVNQQLQYQHNLFQASKENHHSKHRKANHFAQQIDNIIIREMVIGQYNPSNTAQSVGSNNPNNNYYLCARDENNHIYIYNIFEAMLSYIPKKLLTIYNYIVDKLTENTANTPDIPLFDKSTSFIDVYLYYIMYLQQKESLFNSINKNSATIPFSTQNVMNLISKQGTSPLFFNNLNLSQYYTLLFSLLQHLPITLRLEYCNVEDKLFLEHKQTLQRFLQQLETDLQSYGDVIFTLYALYINHGQPIDTTLLRNLPGKDNSYITSLLPQLGQNNSEDENILSQPLTTALEMLKQLKKSRAVHVDDQSESETDESTDDDSDDDELTDDEENLVANLINNSSNEMADKRFLPKVKTLTKRAIAKKKFVYLNKLAEKVIDEFDIEYFIKNTILHDFSLNNSYGTSVLNDTHYDTNYEEFKLFQSKLSLYNRLLLILNEKKLILNNHSSNLNNPVNNLIFNILHLKDVNKMNINDVLARYDISALSQYTTGFAAGGSAGEDEDNINVAYTLLSLSPKYQTIKHQFFVKCLTTTQQLNIHSQMLVKQRKYLLTNKLNNIYNNNASFSSYPMSNLLNFNPTNRILYPLTSSHNNHNGIIVLGLIPKMLLFNHNTSTNTITTIPLYFYKPSSGESVHVDFVNDDNITQQQQYQQQQQIKDSLSLQHPTFSQSNIMQYDHGTLNTHFNIPYHLTSCTILNIPQLSMNCVLFSDLSNQLISCSLPPKFPTTVPNMGCLPILTRNATVSPYIIQQDLIKNAITNQFVPFCGPSDIYSIFQWDINKQNTDHITNNKLILYNAASKNIYAKRFAALRHNKMSLQAFVKSQRQKIQNNTSDPQFLFKVINNGLVNGCNNNSQYAFINVDPSNIRIVKHNGTHTPAITTTIPQKPSIIDNGNALVQLSPAARITKPTPTPPVKKDDLDDLFGDGGDDDDDDDDIFAPKTKSPLPTKRELKPMDDLDDLFGDTSSKKSKPNNAEIKTISDSTDTLDSIDENLNSFAAQDALPEDQAKELLSKLKPLLSSQTNNSPKPSQFDILTQTVTLTTLQQQMIFYIVLFTQSLAAYNPAAQSTTHVLIKQTLNLAANRVEIRHAALIHSTSIKSQSLLSPSPSALPHAYIYTNPCPRGVFHIKQLTKTPSHLLIHPSTHTICVATRTIMESGSAEILEPFQPPVTVNSYQLDFFSLSTGSWLTSYYNVVNPLYEEFKSEPKLEQTVTCLTILTLYDDKSKTVQEKLLKTAVKSKFGIWTQDKQPITPQTHPQAYNTINYIALATSERQGPLQPIKSQMSLLEVNYRHGRDHLGNVKTFLKVQKRLNHVERLPIHGLAVLSYDLQHPKRLSYPVQDELIAHINNYCNPFNHFHTHIVMASGYKIYIYRINYDEGKLVGEAFYDCSFFITSIYCVKNLIFVNDVLKSITMLLYDVANRNLALFASDHNTTLPLTASTPLLAHRKLSLLLFDYDKHISHLEYNIRDPISIRYKRLLTTFKYHLGFNVLSNAMVNVSDLYNKINLNLYSKFVDITSKNPLYLTNEHDIQSEIHHIPVSASASDNIIKNDDGEDVIDFDTSTRRPQITSGLITTATETRGFDLSLFLYHHMKQLQTVIAQSRGVPATVMDTTRDDTASRRLVATTTLSYKPLFAKLNQHIVLEYIQKYDTAIKFQPALAWYKQFLHNSQLATNGGGSSCSNVSCGFLGGNGEFSGSTVTSAIYSTTQTGSLLLFVPITQVQQQLLTLLCNQIEDNFPFIAGTVPSVHYQAKNSANFTEGNIINTTSQTAGIADPNNPAQALLQSNLHNIHKSKQSFIIDFSLLQFYVSLQQKQKRSLAKSIASTPNTVMDLIKYLLLTSYLHPVV